MYAYPERADAYHDMSHTLPITKYPITKNIVTFPKTLLPNAVRSCVKTGLGTVRTLQLKLSNGGLIIKRHFSMQDNNRSLR